MAYDAKALCMSVEETENGALRFEADTHVVYPATIERILASFDEVEPPAELLLPAAALNGREPFEYAGEWRKGARRIPAAAWDDALIPRADLPIMPAPVDIDALGRLGVALVKRNPMTLELLATCAKWDDGFRIMWKPALNDTALAVVERLALRAVAIEHARSWFLAALRVQAPNHHTIGALRDTDRRFKYT